MKQVLKVCQVIVITLGLVTPLAAKAESCVANIDDTISFVSDGNLVETERLADFTALIAIRDLFNSSGLRLRNFAAVIQQDRANLHKSGKADTSGDWHDQQDSYFTTLERRSLLSSAPYYMPCHYSAADANQLKSDIVDGRILGVLWVVLFRHPDGNLAITVETVN